MKTSIIGLLLIIISVQGSLAQDSSLKHEIINLSKQKWLLGSLYPLLNF